MVAKKKREENNGTTIRRVSKPNGVAEARVTGESITKQYMDILDMVLARINLENPLDINMLEYKFYFKDYPEEFGYKSMTRAYNKYMASLGRAIMENKTEGKDTWLEFNDPTLGHVYTTIFASIRFGNDQSFTAVLSKDFKYYLIQQREVAGQNIFYCLRDTLSMSYLYAKKFYPLLMEFRSHPAILNIRGSLKGQTFTRFDSIERFRELLAIPESYGTGMVKKICENISKEIARVTPYKAVPYYNEVPSKQGYPAVTHICWELLSQQEAGFNCNPEIDRIRQKVIIPWQNGKRIQFSLKNAWIIAEDAYTAMLKDEELVAILNLVEARAGKIKSSAIGYCRTLIKRYAEPIEEDSEIPEDTTTDDASELSA